MKALHQFIDSNVHPLFKEGSKLEKYWPVYDGFYTFLFTPGHTADGKAPVRDGADLKRTMNSHGRGFIWSRPWYRVFVLCY